MERMRRPADPAVTPPLTCPPASRTPSQRPGAGAGVGALMPMEAGVLPAVGALRLRDGTRAWPAPRASSRCPGLRRRRDWSRQRRAEHLENDRARARGSRSRIRRRDLELKSPRAVMVIHQLSMTRRTARFGIPRELSRRWHPSRAVLGRDTIAGSHQWGTSTIATTASSFPKLWTPTPTRIEHARNGVRGPCSVPSPVHSPPTVTVMVERSHLPSLERLSIVTLEPTDGSCLKYASKFFVPMVESAPDIDKSRDYLSPCASSLRPVPHRQPLCCIAREQHQKRWTHKGLSEALNLSPTRP